MTFHYVPLPDTACLEVRGADAGAFLHGQLSGAVADLDASGAPLAGWADARGRVRALLRVVRLGERWLLVTPRDGADELAKKLRMFVLRAKVELVLADAGVAGLLGGADEWLEQQGVPPRTPPNRSVRRDELTFVRVGPAYWQVLGAPAALTALGAKLTPAREADAALAEIRLGIPAVTPAIAEHYVAQMLNLDALGAVAFDKGCYPGQEIIARVHNLGGVKRRARRYAAQGAVPSVGAAVLAATGTAVGEIVRSAATDGGAEVLAVVDHAAADAELTSGGASLRELPLPFAVPRD